MLINPIPFQSVEQSYLAGLLNVTQGSVLLFCFFQLFTERLQKSFSFVKLLLHFTVLLLEFTLFHNNKFCSSSERS